MEIAIISDTHLPNGGRRLPEECLRRLRAADVIIHAGELRTVDVLAEIHDAGPAPGHLRRLRARFPNADAVIFGHSHIPLHERDGHGFQIFNPAARASAGDRRTTRWGPPA